MSGQGLLAVGFDHRTSREVVTQGVPVVPARRLPSMLRQLPAVLEPERVPAVADQARIRFHAAA